MKSEAHNHFGKRQGFTLIEMIVALVIVGILSGLGINAFMRISRRQAVDLTYDRLKQVISQTRAFAQAGRIDCGGSDVCGCADADLSNDIPLDSWRISVDVSGLLYNLNGYCGANNFSNRGSDSIGTGVNLSVTPAGTSWIGFRPLGRGRVSNPSTTVNVVYTIRDATTGYQRIITITENGEIY